MPALTNPRHELFVQKLSEGMGQRAAYSAAGYSLCASAASALIRKPDIVARRAELLEELAIQTGVTAGKLIAKAEAARVLAMDTEQPAAAIAAIKEIGILAGVRVEKRSSTTRTVKELSDEELMAIVAGAAH
ncbi:hypothetical protein IZ6_12950 [Terrihabitans soli]|uniref:Terminase small subunit n=1 Tax=Terrihabitans soli TaxID=708113 RepID=A0A6S6QUC8_9HYPH|nr:hypothetical protein [Terrihabitans soli]BCJ90560.1 hypothetical protein IZ6_12950 [Terrihabitans soli]